MQRLLVALFLLALLGPVVAQTPVQDVTIYAPLRPIPCNLPSVDLASGQQVLFLENMVDGKLPSPLYIDGTTLWIDGVAPFGTAGGAHSTGNIGALVDPQQQYIFSPEGGYPWHQAQLPYFLKMIGVIEIAPGASIKSDWWTKNPVRYSAGDAILVTNECAGGNPVSGLLLVYAQHPDDLKDLPAYDGKRIYFTSWWTSNASPVSLRSVYPGPSLGTSPTAIRVRASMSSVVTGAAAPSTINHLAACIQSGTTSNCASPPVELKVGLLSGYPLTGVMHMWTDWTPFTVAPGQNVLVISDYFNPGNAGNNWGNLLTGGLGVWSGSQPSWNTLSMGGAVTSYPNATSSVDWVQFK